MDNNGYVGYEYKTFTVSREVESLYTDNLENFGWIPDGVENSIKGLKYITLKFKRNRDIENRTQLGRLELQFEKAVAEIQRLELVKKLSASAVAYGIGIVGTAFMAGSVFAITDNHVALSIVFAVPALVGWVLPYFLYVTMVGKKTIQVEPLINDQYNVIYDTGKQAHGLL